MQDRYAGDIGDFTKFALLKELSEQGLSIGVNWYRTKPLESEMNEDNTFKKNDGGYSISSEIEKCDSPLAEEMRRIANSDERSVEVLKSADFVQNTVYYDKWITLDKREEWHEQALKFCADNHVDLVFLDPDNGLCPSSVKGKQKRSVKYVFSKEIVQYIENGYSVLFYNHRSRKPELKYFREIESRLRSEEGLADAEILEITFPRCSVRDYFAIPANDEHAAKIRKALDKMMSGVWIETRASQKPLTMEPTFSEYRARFKPKRDFLRHLKALPEDIVRSMIERDPANTTVKACMYSTWESSKSE